MNCKIIAKRFFSLILMLSMVVSMMCMAPASAEVQADIILTTTGLNDCFGFSLKECRLGNCYQFHVFRGILQ